jgi:hypothetical protein
MLVTATDKSFTFLTLNTYDLGGGVTTCGSTDLNPARFAGPTHGTWALTGERSFI